MKIAKIYLSGGMHGDWQDILIDRYPLIEFIDPRKSGCETPEDYTKWDMIGIDECDVVIAYLESTNPSGVGLAFEAGYAMGQGKIVYFANEKEDRYFNIVNHGVTFAYNSLTALLEDFDNHYMDGLYLLDV